MAKVAGENFGGVAQLGEYVNGIHGVMGSIPIISTRLVRSIRFDLVTVSLAQVATGDSQAISAW